MARWGVLLSAAGVSILPMNLHLNAWIQVIRLLDCGGRYLPTCVYDGGRRGDPGMPAPPGNVVALHQAEPAAPEAGPDCAATAGAVARLTPREREVLTLVAAGRPNKVIANELSVSAHTVKLHIHRIMAKLGVSNRTEAAICFHHRDG
ncbi:LuxR family transcriptional regulator [Pseudooceanicola sp. CBS1P-1]|uniref:DNA-binding response regulator n=2 Tax=Paracoccaceae TaxID=31989 RepID=A0A6L7G047_9RHOB|nr:LuxR family transcriptional regulator [Pseudooceanicola endophyticus]MXN16868.1 DNA-binding response regulator [Pseudooceanicola albus]